MKSQSLVAVMALALSAAGAQASVISEWNFNSSVPDGSTGTGSIVPGIGSGTASLLGGISGSFSSGAANGGSSDPALTDNSGWQTTGYAAQGTGDKSRGVQFNVSTVGLKDIAISYDLRHSNTSSRYELVQYSLDGINFIDSTLFDGNAGDTWFNGRSVDFSSIAGVADNANFAFRIVASFAPDSLGYLASNSASNYAASGTWRFDMVSVTGSPVPVPAAFWMMGSGLVALLGLHRRRNMSVAA
ncbi:VPLPA-CTERM sorting domain-containing protein [Methylomonas sp. SURF-2]|uniref:VPLPA-CTERM sorting domain-containing protein n=1 Tax=Methylomonas subterranea TaxID=2952225 RepID=A0ABT1TDG0_9GAMM|nr:VPLPA-CTERM sorting domain-containing protein [Methylomonas sp. SURF-2]MCQ8103492.1 VPLPA-CTERM sorting domain-containing protein [Methylomonas sp. SURF-2]